MRIKDRKKLPNGEVVIFEDTQREGYRGTTTRLSRLEVRLHKVLPDTWLNRLRVRLWPDRYAVRGYRDG